MNRSILAAALLLAAMPRVRGEEAMLGWFSPELRHVERELAEKKRALAALGEPVVGQTVPQFGFQHLQMPAPPPESPFVQLDLGTSQRMDTIALVPAIVDFQPIARTAYGFPRRFRVDVSDDPTFFAFTPVFVHTNEDFHAPGVAPVVLAAGGKSARYLRMTVTRLAEENSVHFFALAEVMILQGNRNVALGAAVAASNSATLPPRWSPQNLVDGRTPLGPPIRGPEMPKFDALFAAEPSETEPAWMGVDLGREVSVEEVRLHPLHSRQGADVPGFAFPLRFRVELAATEDFANATTLFDSTPLDSGVDFPNPGNNPVTLRAAGQRGRFLRVVMLKRYRPAQTSFALSELEVYADGQNVARGARVISSGDPRRDKERPLALLTDGMTSFGRLMELPEWLAEWSQRARLEAEIGEIEARVPTLEAGARRHAAWSGAGAAACIAIASLAFAARAQRRRREELEQFRARLAQDFHDEIGSNLAAMARLSETAELEADKTSSDWREVHQIARETTDAMREVLWLAGARAEAGIDLMEHLQLAAARLLPGCEVHWLTVAESLPEAWPIEARRQVFLFFKEALANVVRHARASRVELSARADAGTFELIVEDNGRGFRETEARAGLGLRGLRERARGLGGSATIDSQPGRGTRVVLQVPIPRAETSTIR